MPAFRGNEIPNYPVDLLLARLEIFIAQFKLTGQPDGYTGQNAECKSQYIDACVQPVTDQISIGDFEVIPDHILEISSQVYTCNMPVLRKMIPKMI